ncbi:hypothetical protein ACOBQJ_14230 [Pelotomaculum propionicicum]|uniref:hypothetical protein n=1 Tax=Pelotomaculum propionicicum TaxID=258475 RepID=UPI003B79709E
MLAFRRISYIVLISLMLALFFFSPRQTAASVPGLPIGSVSDRFLVGDKPDRSEASKNLNNTGKDKEKVKTSAEGSNARSDMPKKDASDLNDAVAVQKVDNSAEGVSCDDLGMVPDDEAKGLYNYNILLAEVKKGIKINVYGTYYLQSPYSANSIENVVDASLFLSGKSSDISKLILKGGEFFDVKGKALIENISIECPTSRCSYLISMTAPFVNNITFRNNYITGNIRLITSDIPINFDFISTLCYIENLTVENNEFHDVYNSEGSLTVIRAVDTPVKSAYIRDNKVTNFSYVFYDNSINNDNLSVQYLIENSNAVIENNEVICTDDYDAITKNGGKKGYYYCFAVIEGFSVECRGNIFAGFHTSDAPDTYVYDNYFSVTKLLYENNTWRNIVNFTPSIEYVDIMKSKYAPEVAGEKTERIYRNNTYIVEPDYADRFGKDRFLLRKEINTWQGGIDRIIIEDNDFDMYILSFTRYGEKFKELYKFNRNKILTDTIEHSINTQNFAYVGEMKDKSGEFIPRDLIFTNNTITCGNEPFGQAIGTKKSSLLCYEAGSGDKTRVDFSNNNINVPGLVTIISGNRAFTDIAASVNFENNRIVGIEPIPELAKLPVSKDSEL